MTWSPTLIARPEKLLNDAEKSRRSGYRRLAAAMAVLIYNLVGVADILSTVIALKTGAGVEANPVLRTLMEQAGDNWIYGKLALQVVISAMVLWYPHWIVVGFFVAATIGNAFVVFNNFAIAGVF